MANPRRLDKATHTTLINSAQKGATNRDAAILAGIDEATLYRWLADTNPSPKLRELQEAYTTAQAASRQRSITLIAESEDWRAHAWLMERRDPKHWGKAEIDIGGLETKLAAYLRGHADGQAAATKQENADA